MCGFSKKYLQIEKYLQDHKAATGALPAYRCRNPYFGHLCLCCSSKNAASQTNKWAEIKQFQPTWNQYAIIPTRQMKSGSKLFCMGDLISFGFI